MYFYAQKNLIELEFNIDTIRKQCTRKILELCNREYFNNRYQTIVNYTE